MKKLNEKQLEVLVAKRNKAGEEAIVAIMNNEELAAYRINCVEAIERLNNEIKRKAGGIPTKFRIDIIETLEGYVAYIDAKLAEEKNKATGEAAIDQFLANYKEKSVKYFMELTAKYNEKKNSETQITPEGLRMVPANAWGGRRYSDERIDKIMNKVMNDEYAGFELDHFKAEIRHHSFKEWTSIFPKSHIKIVENVRFIKDEETLKLAIGEIIDRDVQAKKESLYKLVEKKAGKIIDAQYLRVGLDGELNGFIIGDQAKVNVTSFGAGGWNIQKYHYRLKVTVAK